MAEQWQITGDFVDFCKCAVPCPCSWGRPPSEGDCDGIIAWHVREGRYGDVELDGLNVVGLGQFEGNIWDDGVTMRAGFVLDERADDAQRQALQTIFAGEAGGWPEMFVKTSLGEMLGLEVAPIEVEIADDSESWSVNIAGLAQGRSEVLTGPTSLPGKAVRVQNIPGAEAGPNSGPTTYGIAEDAHADGFGMTFDVSGRSSKHMPFEWSSEDEF
ncbi:MAG: DUF1326 domain-containing protein [Thermoleophilaceae bacterium]